MLSFTEENYLKTLLKITSQDGGKKEAGTNEMAILLGVKPATATDMLKKLKEKDLVEYEKYGKITLTQLGRKKGLLVIRKHRLWETFLCEKLDFSWDEVHDVAEQLEHIQSEKLVNKLEEFLNFPKFDPHGDPIPQANGEVPKTSNQLLNSLEKGALCKVVAVKDTSTDFLLYLEKLNISIGTQIEIIDKIPFDESMIILISDKLRTNVSNKFCENLLVI
jgi:DtxR family Mn-dependent transcriptional regulator